MRLLYLDSKTSKWTLQDFSGQRVPVYLILSHTWGQDKDEIKFEDIKDGQRKYNDISKSGYSKLRFCQMMAERDGLRYFWIDTCCIKKSDSSELQRSLASMFYWYQRAARCYVLLSDVSERDKVPDSSFPWETAFSRSRWFKRGWTLQELLASSDINFFTLDYGWVGTKKGLASTISTVTKIPIRALQGLELSRFSVDERFNWASGRSTTVPEDSSYCLIGIFDVEIPVLYADGEFKKRKEAAMRKLRKAISEKVADTVQHEAVIRIGGASWSDLTTLSERSLEALDTDLEEFSACALTCYNQHPLRTLYKEAGLQMKALLAKHGVQYRELIYPVREMLSGEAAADLSVDANASSQDRVQAVIGITWKMNSRGFNDLEREMENMNQHQYAEAFMKSLEGFCPISLSDLSVLP